QSYIQGDRRINAPPRFLRCSSWWRYPVGDRGSSASAPMRQTGRSRTPSDRPLHPRGSAPCARLPPSGGANAVRPSCTALRNVRFFTGDQVTGRCAVLRNLIILPM
ncbi:unnamed protein product, partial [Musa acuminata subsp. burmannicoides]